MSVVCVGGLQARWERAAKLEGDLHGLEAQVSDGAARLKRARAETAEANESRERVAARLPEVSRRAKQVRERFEATERELIQELERHRKHERDNEGLWRTLVRLQDRVQTVAEHASQCHGEAEEEQDLLEVARVEEESLRRTIEGLQKTQQADLEQRLALAREKRKLIEASAIAKLQRAAAREEHIVGKASGHQSELDALQDQADEAKERAQVAWEDCLHWREAAERARAYVDDQFEARREMHRELVDLQTSHAKVKKDLEHIYLQLGEIKEIEGAAQKEWRLKHLERVDARAEKHRALNQEFVIAEVSPNTEFSAK